MNRVIGVAIVVLLAGMPMSIVGVESVPAQTIQGRKADADRLLEQGVRLYRASHYREAIPVFESALGIYREIKDRDGEAIALLALGRQYASLGEYQKAIEYYQQSIALQKQIGDLEGEKQSLISLSAIYDFIDDHEKLITIYEQLLKIYRRIGYRTEEIKTLEKIGDTAGAVGRELRLNLELAKALKFHQIALEVYILLNDRKRQSQNLAGIGYTYDLLGQPQKALPFLQSALKITREISDFEGECSVLGFLGELHHYSLRNYIKALEYHQKALSICQKGKVGVSYALSNIGFAFLELKQLSQALSSFQKSLEIEAHAAIKGYTLYGLGKVYFNLGKYLDAIETFQQSLLASERGGNVWAKRETLSIIGDLLREQNQPELSIVFYKKAVNFTEKIRQQLKTLNREEQKTYTSTVESTYRNLADILIKQDRVMEALQILDLLKVQELEAYLKNIKGSERSVQGVRLLEPEKAISNQLPAINFDNSKEINSQLSQQIQQLPKSEINKVPDYLNQIPQGNVLIYPLILSDRLEIILFAPNTLPIHRTVAIKQTELEALVKEFRAQLRRKTDDFSEPAQKLYSLLIKPIESELINAKTTNILYAPDGILRYIPLAALYDGKQWLAEKYQISNLIAYSLSDFSPKSKIEPSILAGAFGGKTGERKFGQNPLPASIREVQAIANLFQNSVTLFESDFSRATTEAKFKTHNILHFATHAEFNTGAPDNSFIIFGNGDKIRLSELTDWQIPNVNLIVLSACETGLGTLGSGVEILGFGYQVQKAGAKQAIASLWSVNDEGTQVLMEAFYRELQKGDVAPSEALRRAQVSLIKSAKYNHPFFWSAFFAIGNGL